MAIDGPHGTAMAIDELRWDLSTGNVRTCEACPLSTRRTFHVTTTVNEEWKVRQERNTTHDQIHRETERRKHFNIAQHV